MKGAVCIFLFIALLVSHAARAQYPSLHNRFTVDEVKGCAPFTIQVNYPACDGTTVSCAAIYGNGRIKSFVNGDTLTYVRPGAFRLKIVYSTTVVDNDSIQLNVTNNVPPAFEAYSCNGYQVKVDVTDNNYAYYFINYNDGNTVGPLPAVSAEDIHTYAAPPPATRNVSVRGYNGPGTKDNCQSGSLPVTVANVLPAAAISQVEVLNPTEVKVDFTTSPSVQYRFTIATNNITSFQQYKNIYSPTVTAQTETITGIRPDDNFYCFRLDTFNPCGNNVVSTSPVVCSQNFDAVAQNNQNNLVWTTGTRTAANNFTDYTLLKNSVALTPNVPFSQFSFADTDVVCNTLYEYQVITNYPGGVRSLSLKKSVTAFSNDVPPAVADISAAVDGALVALDWPAVSVPLQQYKITKSESGGSFTQLGTATTPSYTDATYSNDVPSCYKVDYTDQCNNQSPLSIEACPIHLQGTLQSDNVINLSWTAYTGWTSGVGRYVVEKYDERGQLLQSQDVSMATTFTDNTQDLINQVFQYRIFAYANNGALLPSASNTIIVIKQPNLFYPTAFTPNRDGLNDTFKVFGQFVAAFEMKIFNRWGELMFTTDDLGGDGWDGTYRGDVMPEATYVFTAKLKDLAGRSFERSGSVVLLRKK